MCLIRCIYEDPEIHLGTETQHSEKLQAALVANPGSVMSQLYKGYRNTFLGFPFFICKTGKSIPAELSLY